MKHVHWPSFVAGMFLATIIFVSVDIGLHIYKMQTDPLLQPMHPRK